MNVLFQISPQAQVVALTEHAECQALLRTLEHIAQELGWQPGCQLHTCHPQAQHLAVLVQHEKEHREIVGGMQFVSGRQVMIPKDAGPYTAEPEIAGSDTNGFAFHRIWPEMEVSNPGATIHITILALRQEHRGRFGLFWPLCVELWRHCVAHGVYTIMLEATPSTLKLYQRLGWPLEIVGELRMHWGEECYLCRMDVQGVADALLVKAEKSQTYQALVQQAYPASAPSNETPSNKQAER